MRIKRPCMHAAFLYHSPIQPFQKHAARGSLLKNPRSQKGLIKKNYWELSFWQKHEKGVTSALLFLLFQMRGATLPVLYAWCGSVARVEGPHHTTRYNYPSIYGINKNGKRERIAAPAMEFARVFPLCCPLHRLQPLQHVHVTLIYKHRNNSAGI
jgi:hypothetical protein